MLDLDKESETNEQYVRWAYPNRMPNGSIESIAAGELPDSTTASTGVTTVSTTGTGEGFATTFFATTFLLEVCFLVGGIFILYLILVFFYSIQPRFYYIYTYCLFFKYLSFIFVIYIIINYIL
jgi:hypothetical protein